MAKEKLNLILCATKEALYNLKRKNNEKIVLRQDYPQIISTFS